MNTVSYLGNTYLELFMFSNSGQIILSAVFHKLGYGPHFTNEEAEAQSSTTPSEHRGRDPVLGQSAGWLLLDHTADIPTWACWVRKQESQAVWWNGCIAFQMILEVKLVYLFLI